MTGQWDTTPQGIPSIVEYTDAKRPRNEYPRRMVSPTLSRPCCQSGMRAVGEPVVDVRYVFQYKRCKRCGFTVRNILREVPDHALAEQLKVWFSINFVRNLSGSG